VAQIHRLQSYELGGADDLHEFPFEDQKGGAEGFMALDDCIQDLLKDARIQ